MRSTYVRLKYDDNDDVQKRFFEFFHFFFNVILAPYTFDFRIFPSSIKNNVSKEATVLIHGFVLSVIHNIGTYRKNTFEVAIRKNVKILLRYCGYSTGRNVLKYYATDDHY